MLLRYKWKHSLLLKRSPVMPYESGRPIRNVWSKSAYINSIVFCRCAYAGPRCFISQSVYRISLLVIIHACGFASILTSMSRKLSPALNRRIMSQQRKWFDFIRDLNERHLKMHWSRDALRAWCALLRFVWAASPMNQAQLISIEFVIHSSVRKTLRSIDCRMQHKHYSIISSQRGYIIVKPLISHWQNFASNNSWEWKINTKPKLYVKIHSWFFSLYFYFIFLLECRRRGLDEIKVARAWKYFGFPAARNTTTKVFLSQPITILNTSMPIKRTKHGIWVDQKRMMKSQPAASKFIALWLNFGFYIIKILVNF